MSLLLPANTKQGQQDDCKRPTTDDRDGSHPQTPTFYGRSLAPLGEYRPFILFFFCLLHHHDHHQDKNQLLLILRYSVTPHHVKKGWRQRYCSYHRVHIQVPGSAPFDTQTFASWTGTVPSDGATLKSQIHTNAPRASARLINILRYVSTDMRGQHRSSVPVSMRHCGMTLTPMTLSE